MCRERRGALGPRKRAAGSGVGSPRLRIDLNADIGESFGSHKTGNDEDLLRSITSGSIACGFHAGDPSVMRQTVRLAAERRRGDRRASRVSGSRGFRPP